jgi:hypothetical protein
MAKVPMAVVGPSDEHLSHRPMLYAMSTYGQEGVERALQILKVGRVNALFFHAET